MASEEISNRSKKFLAILEKDTKGSAKDAAYKTLAQVGVGVAGGVLGATLIGKPSFYLGLAALGWGNYKGNVWLAPLGMGMMASSIFVPGSSSADTGFSVKNEIQDVQDRFVSLKKSFLSKTYLDKILPKGTASKTNANRSAESGDTGEDTSGFGSVRDHLDTLRQIDEQLVSSAVAFENQRQGTSGKAYNVEGFDETDVSGF